MPQGIALRIEMHAIRTNIFDVIKRQIANIADQGFILKLNSVTTCHHNSCFA
jgi:hypothetical protein